VTGGLVVLTAEQWRALGESLGAVLRQRTEAGRSPGRVTDESRGTEVDPPRGSCAEEQPPICWCDGDPTCPGDSAEGEYGLCRECRELGHLPLPPLPVLLRDDVGGL
jgi:hypothetical protein